MPEDSRQSWDELDRLRALQAACRGLRQADLAGVLKASDHRSAALCEKAWHEVAGHIDHHAGERRIEPEHLSWAFRCLAQIVGGTDEAWSQQAVNDLVREAYDALDKTLPEDLK